MQISYKFRILEHALLELLCLLPLPRLPEYKQVFMHDHQEVGFHGLLDPIGSALALQLMFYYVYLPKKYIYNELYTFSIQLRRCKSIETVIPLDTKDPLHPVIIMIIKKWNPFEYVVTLKAFIGNESRDIRRWDNIGKKDHMDIFYLYKKTKKHQKAPIRNIRNLKDLKSLLEYIDRNHKRFIEGYKR